MSWDIFKNMMKSYMDNPNGVKSKEAFAKQFTTAYDMAIKPGSVVTRGIVGLPLPLAKGNTDVMEKLMIAACAIAFTKSETGKHRWLKDIGQAVIGYWSGATLSQVPPMIPALLSFQNIALTSGVVSNPGKWPNTPPEQPIDDSGKFLDLFISYAQIHLSTLQFSCSTISLYPGFPLIPALPGYISLTGYTLTPASPSPSSVIQEPGLLDKIVEKIKDILTQDDSMSPEQIESAKVEVAEAEVVVNDVTLPEVGRTSASEYVGLKKSEISSGKLNALPVDLTDEEIKAIEDETPDNYKCEVGTKIVAIAKKDIGILETGTPPGLNYGGFPGGVQNNRRGRIDDMFDNVGLDNQSKVRKTGSGYYWCAAAVSTWWQEAGLETPNGGASCDNWMRWGKSKGYWSSEPKIGAAVLYGSPSDAHHIGIVAGVTPNGSVITIEGNTSGGGFSRNGCGVFQKIPKKYLGFVIPPGC